MTAYDICTLVFVTLNAHAYGTQEVHPSQHELIAPQEVAREMTVKDLPFIFESKNKELRRIATDSLNSAEQVMYMLSFNPNLRFQHEYACSLVGKSYEDLPLYVPMMPQVRIY